MEIMHSMVFLLLMVWHAALAASLDLGPIVRIAQCRSQCLRKHSVDGSCDWYSNRGETVCSECWQNCEALEDQWESSRSICEGEEYQRCPACQTSCDYRKTRIEEIYLPTMLPAPSRGPVLLKKHDVAILLRKVHGEWRESGYYPGERAPTLRPDTWIVVVVEDGIEHYSWEEWVPTLDALKAGPLYEASISWKDVQVQLKRQRDVEQKRFNDRVRQFFLEKYGEKLLAEWRSQDQDSQISDEVFRRFFFKRKDSHTESGLDDDKTNPIGATYNVNKESYVVSWEPEAGGLMGNQVTDSRSAQISLLPGVKYLVRVATDDGPGSFPIEIDTRPSSVQIVRLKKNFENIYLWAIVAASGSCAALVVLMLLVKICRRGKQIEDPEEI